MIQNARISPSSHSVQATTRKSPLLKFRILQVYLSSRHLSDDPPPQQHGTLIQYQPSIKPMYRLLLTLQLGSIVAR